MRTFFLITIAFIFTKNFAKAQEIKTINPIIPKVTFGTIKHYENFSSKYLPAHNVDVWLPEGYNAQTKYAVLYMNDGKGLFDSTITWNKQEWSVDETLGKLLQQRRIKKTIVVGIWNGDKNRHSEYFPQKPFETLDDIVQDSMYKIRRNDNLLFSTKINSDSYLKFLVEEVKPFIDKNFSTLKNKENTFIAGSSMGGLISWYAMCEYPKVFGGAACISTHWPGVPPVSNNPVPAAFIQYINNHFPSPKDHKLYFDYGTATLDSFYKPYQLQADSLFAKKGFSFKNYFSKEFIGDAHAEYYWRKRLDIPLLFLLKK